MTTPYQKNFDGTLPITDTGLKTILAASTALGWTVPGTANQKFRAEFHCSATAEIFVKLNGTAALPSSNTATQTYNEEMVLPGMARYVKGGDTLSFISVGTPSISISLLKVEDIT